MEMINIGQSVKIKRTDGRVHGAVVSKVNPSGQCITVEWYERGETKGKEVELEAILSLNPELTQSYAEAQHTAPEPKKQATAPNNLSRNPTQSSIGGGGGGVGGGGGGSAASLTARLTLASNQLHKINETNTQTAGSQLGNSQSYGNITAANTGGGSSTTGMLRPRYTQTSSNAGHTRISSASNIANSDRANGRGDGSSTTSTVAATAATAATAAAAGSGAGGASTASTNNSNNLTGNVSGSRRSHALKEVERLKENREKRRARQAEIKEEKVALMNQDPGNPNWETAQMIREYQSMLEFIPLIDGQAVDDHQITVCVRKRPLSRKELNRKEIDVISVPRKDTMLVHEPRNKVDLTKFLENHKFRFDYAFNDTCDNAMVYR